MKKLITSIAIVCLVLGIFPVRAGIEGQVLDQSFEAAGMGATTISNYGRKQSFRPTNDTLTSFEFYLGNMQNGSTITLKVADFSETQILYQETKQLTISGDGWETFAPSAPYVKVTPEARYWLKLECSDSLTMWQFGPDGYPRGVFGSFTSNDAFFRVYSIAPTPNQPIAQNDTSIPADSTSSVTPKTEKGQTIAPVSADIASPVLAYIMVNEERIEAPVSEAIEIKENDKVTVFGTAPQGMNVVLFVGEEFSFTGTASVEGKWEIELDNAVLGSGEFDVRAQTQNNEGKGSEIANLFVLKKTVETQPVEAVKEEPQSLWDQLIGKYLPYTTAGLFLLLILALIALHFTQKKYLKNHKSGDPDLGEKTLNLPNIKKGKKTKGKIIDIKKQ